MYQSKGNQQSRIFNANVNESTIYVVETKTWPEAEALFIDTLQKEIIRRGEIGKEKKEDIGQTLEEIFYKDLHTEHWGVRELPKPFNRKK